MTPVELPFRISQELEEYYQLTEEQIQFYQKNRYIKIKNVLSEDTLIFFNNLITNWVEKMNSQTTLLKKRGTYERAFIQIFNLWQHDPIIKKLVFSKRMAKIANDLMNTKGVKLYHDQALFKESGGGITPWHADQYYWPLDSDKTTTLWIPLQATPLEMGPLEFSSGSHQIVTGRELEISDKSEEIIQQHLKVTSFPHIIEPFDLGEVSFHSGWIFHRAGANKSNHVRKVMTIIYMDKSIKLKKPENENQFNDWKQWCPEAVVGETINTQLNPILFKSR